MKLASSSQESSCSRISRFGWQWQQQEMRVGKSTVVRRASLKYWNGNWHSCCRTVGGWPDWMIACKQKQCFLCFPHFEDTTQQLCTETFDGAWMLSRKKKQAGFKSVSALKLHFHTVTVAENGLHFQKKKKTFTETRTRVWKQELHSRHFTGFSHTQFVFSFWKCSSVVKYQLPFMSFAVSYSAWAPWSQQWCLSSWQT